jgi:hypothetical protein
LISRCLPFHTGLSASSPYYGTAIYIRSPDVKKSKVALFFLGYVLPHLF